MDEWVGWPPGWPQEERLLEGRQSCRRCGRQLKGTVGRPVPGVGWMHRDCAIRFAAEHEAKVEATMTAVDAMHPNGDQPGLYYIEDLVSRVTGSLPIRGGE
jgi:hypothetical protein